MPQIRHDRDGQIVSEARNDAICMMCSVNPNYGLKRLGSRGNSDALLILPSLRYSITTRSKPFHQACFPIEAQPLTDTAATMGRGSELESVEIPRHALRVDPCHFHAFRQEVWIVYSLSARHDLFASHEEVIRV